jgi:selenoprotein W-related protein
MVDLLNDFETHIKSITLLPSDGGVFEVTVNGKLLFSKANLLRHAEPGELTTLVKNYIKDLSK